MQLEVRSSLSFFAGQRREGSWLTLLMSPPVFPLFIRHMFSLLPKQAVPILAPLVLVIVNEGFTVNQHDWGGDCKLYWGVALLFLL